MMVIASVESGCYTGEGYMRKTVVAALLGAGVLLDAILLVLGGVLFLRVFYIFPDIKRSDLIGIYVGIYDVFPKITARYRKGIYEGGTHLLELKSDGTYIYVYDPVGGNSVTTVGHWQFTRAFSGPEVVLHDFMLAPSKKKDRWAQMTEKPGFWFRSVEEVVGGPIWCYPLLKVLGVGHIRIVINDDHSYYWVKEREANWKSEQRPGGERIMGLSYTQLCGRAIARLALERHG